MKKKIVSLCLCAALLAVAVIGGTLAYFTDEEVATNTFTVGNVNIKLTEPNWDAEEDHNDVYPGEALAKDPTVINIGDNPCFVRLEVTGLDQFGEKGMITLRHGAYVEGFDDENWTYLDGYYYYKYPLAAGYQAEHEETPYKSKVTTPLFNQIVMPTGLTGEEDGNYDVVVKAEAVQAQGARPSWSAVKAMSTAEIAAWFATCMAE